MTGLFVLCLWVIKMKIDNIDNNVEFYSRSFFTGHYGIGELGYNGIDVQKVLDVLFMLEAMKYNNNLLQRPYNILIRYTQSEIVLAITSDKALFTQNIIIGSNKIFNDAENQEETIRNSAFKELGLKPQTFIHFNKESFDNGFNWLLSTFNNKETLKMRSKWLYQNSDEIPHSVEELVDSIDEGLSKNTGRIGDEIMWIDPIFKARELTVNPEESFYIMHFSSKREKIFKLLRDHLDDKFNINLVKSGNETFSFNKTIMESIWTHINTSKFVIADISDQNPNVFYELGICHTLGKPVISICDKKSLEEDYQNKYPFDISALPVLSYSDELGGEKDLLDGINNMVNDVIDESI